MKAIRRLTALLLALLLTAALGLSAAGAPITAEATILFTHDLHSHLLPAEDESGNSYGGYARLKTAIDQQKAAHPDAILVDGGDFSMGSLFQTSYAHTAAELRVMGVLGYDVTTLGNHEYDYGAAALASMLNAAAASGDRLPAIVEGNYLPPREGQEGYDADAQAVWDAFERCGVDDYVLLERSGVWYAILGIMGVDSDQCAPLSGMILHDRFEAAQRMVDEATAYCQENFGAEPIVICLSHSGTENGKGEDYELAKKVKGIDLIVSGHSHTILTEPLRVGDTWIVSCGEYSKYLGAVTLARTAAGDVLLTDYRLIPIDDSLAEDPAVGALVEGYQEEVEETYLRRFGMTFDQVLTYNPYTFESADSVYYFQQDSVLGSLLSDAYKWAAEQATGAPVDVALTASGVIRESIPRGQVTVSQVFNAASLGIGADGIPGYPLISIYLTGKDLKTAMEIDASVSDLMPAARLYCSGVQYAFNTSRMIFNRVTESFLRREDGALEPIENDRLYRVVTGLYCGQMLGSVESASLHLLSITARDASGDPIDMDRLEDYIVHDAGGNEVKEWYAVASYLQSMGGEMDGRYAQPDGRKVIYSSLSPVQMLKNPNKFTIIAVVVILVVLAVLILIIRAVVRKLSRRARRGGTRGYRSYRGKR